MNHRYTLLEFAARYRENFGDAPELADLLKREDARVCGVKT
jgi:hypothetical protein